MGKILAAYKKYDVEYDRKNKIFFIGLPMPVKEFVELKRLLSLTTEKVNDIRLETVYNKRYKRW